MKKSFSRKGFSLVELMFVIAIIGVLAGLSFPVIDNMRERSKRIECMSTMRQWGVALSSYLDEHKEIFPECPEGNADVNDAKAWYNLLPKYIDAPTMKELAASKGGVPVPGVGVKSMFTCSSDHGDAKVADIVEFGGEVNTKYYSSYTFNSWINAAKEKPYTTRLRLPQLNTYVSRLVVISETPDGWKSGVSKDMVILPENHKTAFRHSAGSVMVFADGHADYYSDDVISEEKSVVVWELGKKDEKSGK